MEQIIQQLLIHYRATYEIQTNTSTTNKLEKQTKKSSISATLLLCNKQIRETNNIQQTY